MEFLQFNQCIVGRQKMDGLSEEVQERIIANKLSLEDLPLLTEEEVKELAPRIKDRIELRALIEKYKKDAMVTDPATVQPNVDPATAPPTLPESSSSLSTPTPPSSFASSSLSDDSDWHLRFKIPDLSAFPYSTAKALETGSFSQTSRQHIITQLKVLMLQHTRKPDSKQYTAACQALVEKYPACADSLGSKIGSWKTALTMAFKNFRRDHSPTHDNHSTESSAAKRPRIEELLPTEELDALMGELKAECSKSKGANKKRIRDVMAITFNNRRDWIVSGKYTPAVRDVLEAYPALKQQRELRREFKRITDLEFKAATEAWVLKQSQVLHVGRLEINRPAVRKILQRIEHVPDGTLHENDFKDYAMLELLEKLLYPRGPRGGGLILQHFETLDIDFEEEVNQQPEPFILVIGSPGDDALYSL